MLPTGTVDKTDSEESRRCALVPEGLSILLHPGSKHEPGAQSEHPSSTLKVVSGYLPTALTLPGSSRPPLSVS